MALKIFWKPSGFELDSIGTKRLVDISDGDTPNIRMNVRMLSIDTPETKPVGISRRDLEALLPGVADWIRSGRSPVSNEKLRDHLVARIEKPDVVELHLSQGRKATEAYAALKAERLARPGGSQRSLFVRVADERFDRYGRLLAYVAPSFTAAERASMTRKQRQTFNLDMIENGWAATFVVFPSIPGELDLPLLQEAGRAACEGEKGAWGDALSLTGYEFRMVCRLAALYRDVVVRKREPQPGAWQGWVDRYCCDMSTGLLHSPQDYVSVEPWNRIFIFPRDVRRAVAELNLVPA